MAKNFVQNGNTITVTAPYDVVSGAGCKVGSFFGIAQYSVLSGAAVEIDLVGVFELKKTSAQAWASVGAAIYWDDINKEVTTTSSGNTLIGKNVAVAANPSATGTVRLDG